MDWNLHNIYQHKDTPLVDGDGGEVRYTLSGRGGWTLYRAGRRVFDDMDGLNLCAMLNLAQAEPAREDTNRV